jgi:hypothetical protein
VYLYGRAPFTVWARPTQWFPAVSFTRDVRRISLSTKLQSVRGFNVAAVRRFTSLNVMRTISIAAVLAYTAACGAAPELEQSRSALTAPAIYVDCATGLDSNSGGGTAPVKSIRQAMSLVQPGGGIYIRPGLCEERVVVAQDNIVIERDPATPGTVEVAGSVPFLQDYSSPRCANSNWYYDRYCNEGWRTYYSTFDLYGVHDVTIRNLKITQNMNSLCPATGVPGSLQVDANGNHFPLCLLNHAVGEPGTYVNFDTLNPQTCLSNPNNICVETANGTIAGSGTLTWSCCATSSNPSVCLPDPSLICSRPAMLGSGVSVLNGSSNIRIENNEFTGLVRMDRRRWATSIQAIVVQSDNNSAPVQNVRITGNNFHDITQHQMDGNTYAGQLIVVENYVSNVELDNNRLTNVGGGMYIAGNQNAGLTLDHDRATNVWVHDNRIVNGPSYGIYMDSPRKVLVERNYLFGSQYGIGVATEHARTDFPEQSYAQDIWIRDNVMWSDLPSVAGAAPVVQGIVAGVRGAYHPVRNLIVNSNTIRTNQAVGYAYIQLPGILGTLHVHNNIFINKAGQAVYGAVPSAPQTTYRALYNDYVGSLAAGVPLVTLPSEVGPRFVEPVFVSNTTGDPINSFKLPGNSVLVNPAQSQALPAAPAWTVNAGYLSGVEKDFYNNTRRCSRLDIGADERNTNACP